MKLFFFVLNLIAVLAKLNLVVVAVVDDFEILTKWTDYSMIA